MEGNFVWLHHTVSYIWDLCSLTGDQTYDPCSESAESLMTGVPGKSLEGNFFSPHWKKYNTNTIIKCTKVKFALWQASEVDIPDNLIIYWWTLQLLLCFVLTKMQQ